MLRRGAELLPLGPLAAGDAARLAGMRVGGEPGPGLRRRLDATAGNPLFIRELVDAMGRHDQLRSAAGTVDIAPDAPPAPVVISLEQVIAERIGVLDRESVSLLRTASVIGQEFSVAALAEISGLALPQVLARLHQALDAGIVEGAEDRLRFRHGLIRDSLWHSTPQTIRSGLHAAAAQTLVDAGAPPERAGQHLLQIDDGLPRWTAEWLVGPGSSLIHRAPALAARLIESVLDAGGLPADRWEELSVRLARARFQAGLRAEAALVATRVLARTKDPDLAAELVWIQSHAPRGTPTAAAAPGALTEAMDRWPMSPEWAVRLEVQKATLTGTVGGERSSAAEPAAAALARARDLGDAFATAYALHILAIVASYGGDSAIALAHIDEALEITESGLADSDLRIHLLINRSIASRDLFRMADAKRSLESAWALAERTGSDRTRDIMLHTGGNAFATGDWDETLTTLTAVIEDSQTPVADPLLGVAHAMVAQVLAHRGHTAAAREHLAELDQVITASGAGFLALPAALIRTYLAEQEADATAALAVLEPIVRDDAQVEAATWHMFLPDVLRLARAADRGDVIARVREVLTAHAGQDANPGVTAARLHCLALLDQDPAPGLEAARLLDGMPLHAAWALEDTAEVLATTDRPRARQVLAQAVDLYESLGATVDIARAESRLRARGVRLGARGRRRPSTGWAALTPAEAKVADLVAEGMTNPEIAGRMFLSRRTVQTHVSQILTKLEVAGRSGVVRLAAERQRP
jgi:DNA-binding CsgD family transcriptional regulator